MVKRFDLENSQLKKDVQQAYAKVSEFQESFLTNNKNKQPLTSFESQLSYIVSYATKAKESE